MLRNLLALRQIAKRTISTASRRQFDNKVPEKQKLFQEDNGIPVPLKGGIADALLYRATMILTVGGKLVECLLYSKVIVGIANNVIALTMPVF